MKMKINKRLQCLLFGVMMMSVWACGEDDQKSKSRSNAARARAGRREPKNGSGSQNTSCPRRGSNYRPMATMQPSGGTGARSLGPQPKPLGWVRPHSETRNLGDEPGGVTKVEDNTLIDNICEPEFIKKYFGIHIAGEKLYSSSVELKIDGKWCSLPALLHAEQCICESFKSWEPFQGQLTVGLLKSLLKKNVEVGKDGTAWNKNNLATPQDLIVKQVKHNDPLRLVEGHDPRNLSMKAIELMMAPVEAWLQLIYGKTDIHINENGDIAGVTEEEFLNACKQRLGLTENSQRTQNKAAKVREGRKKKRVEKEGKRDVREEIAEDDKFGTVNKEEAGEREEFGAHPAEGASAAHGGVMANHEAAPRPRG